MYTYLIKRIIKYINLKANGIIYQKIGKEIANDTGRLLFLPHGVVLLPEPAPSLQSMHAGDMHLATPIARDLYVPQLPELMRSCRGAAKATTLAPAYVPLPPPEPVTASPSSPGRPAKERWRLEGGGAEGRESVHPEMTGRIMFGEASGTSGLSGKRSH